VKLMWVVGFGMWATTASSQLPPPTSQTAPKVFLITIGKGAYYWEKYGHNMLWFYDPANRIDQAYNWGQFAFGDPALLLRILTAEANYWVDTVPGQFILNYYQRTDRSIVVQEINFSTTEARRAFERAQWSIRPENRFYRYDYFLDNCSTRVRDVIDYAFGGAVKSATQDTVDQTYRGETLRLLDDMKLTQLGVDVALARPADRRLTRWEDMFIPMRMRDALRGLQVGDSMGATRPVIAREQVIYQTQRNHERETPPERWIAYLVIGLVIGLQLAILGFVASRSRGRFAEIAFRLEVAAWAFLTGMLGLILLVGWLGTQHTFWYRNENLLLTNPLSLFLAVLVVLSWWRPRFRRSAAIIATIVAMTAAIALILKGIPGSQSNLELIALLLPAHFAIAFHVWLRAVPDFAIGIAWPPRK
jgi:hypothetical protein